MKFSVLATIVASTAAQITIVRPDKTTGVINSAAGCYGIYPSVAEVTNANGFKLEFYEDWNCKGKKVDDSVGNKVFPSPVKALSIKVVPNSRARYLREHKDRSARSHSGYLREHKGGNQRSHARYLLANQARIDQDYENGYKSTEPHYSNHHNSYEVDQEAENDYIPEEDIEGQATSNGYLNDHSSSYETDQQAEDDYIPEEEDVEGSIPSEDLGSVFPEDCDFITENFEGCSNYTVDELLDWFNF